MSFLKSLRNIGSGSSSALSAKDEPEVQLGSELLQTYESYWASIHQRTSLIGRNARLTETELLALCDVCLSIGSEWGKLRHELDTLPAVQSAVTALCESVAQVSMKFDRLEQSLQLCIDSREQHIAAQYTHKKDSQLAKQKQQHDRQLQELTSQLESAVRTAAATYKQQTTIDPPLLHPLPLPNKPIATAYGTADLGTVTATRKLSAVRPTDTQPPRPKVSESATQEKAETGTQQPVAAQQASAVTATEATPLVAAPTAQPAAISET